MQSTNEESENTGKAFKNIQDLVRERTTMFEDGGSGHVPSSQFRSSQRKKDKLKQKAVMTTRKSQVSMMAVCMRYFFVKAFQKYLQTGELKTRYMNKFDVLEIISPKCIVVRPKVGLVSSASPQHGNFIFKYIEQSSIRAYCGTDNPTDFQVSKIIDQWIYLKPKTSNIVTAYEVFKDNQIYMQITEFCQGLEDVYTMVKIAKFGHLTRAIPKSLIKSVYQFVIQISHALSIAHNSNLTHGAFDLTQVLTNTELNTFKVTNFRPWLALGKRYKFNQGCKSQHFKQLSSEDKYRIAKARDVYDFGCALYEFMLAKTSKDEKVEQIIVQQRGDSISSKTDLGVKNQNSNSAETLDQNQQNHQQQSFNEVSPKNHNKSQAGGLQGVTQANQSGAAVGASGAIMPNLDSIPLTWVQINEGASLIEILHWCLLVDTQRDSTEMFARINKHATEYYQKFFDPKFVPLTTLQQYPSELVAQDQVVALNNRAVLNQVKILTKQTVPSEVSLVDNERFLDYSQQLIELACKMDPTCEESKYNRIMMRWIRGQIMDEDVTELILRDLHEPSTRAWLLFAFRKALGMPIDRSWSTQLLQRNIQSELLSQYFSEQMQMFVRKENLKESMYNRPARIRNQQVHITELISNLSIGGSREGPGSSTPFSNTDTSNEIKKIFFSKNEKYMVLLTPKQAIVVELCPSQMHVIGTIDLPRKVLSPRSTGRSKAMSPTSLQNLPTSPFSQKSADSKNNPLSNLIAQKIQMEMSEENGGEKNPEIAQLELKDISDLENEGEITPLKSETSGKNTQPTPKESNKNEKNASKSLPKLRSKQAEVVITDQMRAEKQQREVQVMGFKNSNWIATISNDASIVLLHDTDAVIVTKVEENDGEFTDMKSQSGFIRDIKPVGSDFRRFVVKSEAHIYCGKKFKTHQVAQIGHLCPEEILHMEVDLKYSENVDEDHVSDAKSDDNTTSRSRQSTSIRASMQKLKNDDSKANSDAENFQTKNESQEMGIQNGMRQYPATNQQSQEEVSPFDPASYQQNPSNIDMNRKFTGGLVAEKAVTFDQDIQVPRKDNQILLQNPDMQNSQGNMIGAEALNASSEHLTPPMSPLSLRNQSFSQKLDQSSQQNNETTQSPELRPQGNPNEPNQWIVQANQIQTGQIELQNENVSKQAQGQNENSPIRFQISGQIQHQQVVRCDVKARFCCRNLMEFQLGFQMPSELISVRSSKNKDLLNPTRHSPRTNKSKFGSRKTKKDRSANAENLNGKTTECVFTEGPAYAISLRQPTKMEHGVSFPVSIFRSFSSSKKLELQQNTRRKGLYQIHKTDKDIETKKGENEEQSTQGENQEKVDAQRELLNLLGENKVQCEHMRAFIQKQEMVGNQVKMALFDKDYAIVFQKSTYKNRQPHFFVYSISQRKVVRRFQPLVQQWQQSWSKELVFLRMMTNRTNKIQMDNTDNTQMTEPDDEDFDFVKHEDDVSVFEVSPKGTFLVAFVSNEFVTLKMLDRGIPGQLKSLLLPICMVDESLRQRELATTAIQRTHDTYNSQLSIKRGENENSKQTLKSDNSETQSAILNNEFKSLAQQLIYAFTEFEDYLGSTFKKQIRFLKYHKLLKIGLENVDILIFPPSLMLPAQTTQSASDLAQTQNSQKIIEILSTQEQEAANLNTNSDEVLTPDNSTSCNMQIHPRLMKRVLIAIKEFNFSFSVLTPQNQLQNSTNSTTNNVFSKKVGCLAMRKMYTFDQVLFKRSFDNIKHCLLSSYPRSFKIVIYQSRTLQVYDQTNGQQIFETLAPMAKKLAFVDSENLLVVHSGRFQVMVCAIESQRKAFVNKDAMQKRSEALQVQEHEENKTVSLYTFGLSVQREVKHEKNQSDNSDDSDQEEAQQSIKMIVFDEEIREVITARNICPYGYVALIGDTKMSIYLAYSEEDKCFVDLVYTIRFTDLRRLGIGEKITNLDFSPNCEEFVACTNSGYLAIWSLKKQKFLQKITRLSSQQLPVTQLRSFNDNHKCVAFSEPNNILMIIDFKWKDAEFRDRRKERRLGNQSDRSDRLQDHKRQVEVISPKSDGFGKIVNFQLEVAEKFIICTFQSNKVAIYSLETLQVLLLFEEPNYVCRDSFIDECGCCLTMLDETRKKVDIHVIQWKYEMEKANQGGNRAGGINSRQGSQSSLERQQDGATGQGGGWLNPRSDAYLKMSGNTINPSGRRSPSGGVGGSRSRSGSRDAKKLQMMGAGGNARTFMIGKKKKVKKGYVRGMKIKKVPKRKKDDNEKSVSCSLF